MRRLAPLPVLVLALSAGTPACGGPARPPIAAAQDARAAEKAIDQVLDDWHQAAARAEEARYFAHFAEGAVFLGTDRTERWSLEEFRRWAHPYFAKGKAWTLKSTRRTIAVGQSGDVAWFDEDLASDSMGPARGSGVMVRAGTDRRWRIVQYNLALTIPNDALPAVKKVIEGG